MQAILVAFLHGRRLLLAAAGVFLLCGSAIATPQGDPVVLQLKHTHQFQFAGYYAAVAKGYYREAGLDVTIREGSDGDAPERAVLSGEAQYGTGSSTWIIVPTRIEPA